MRLLLALVGVLLATFLQFAPSVRAEEVRIPAGEPIPIGVGIILSGEEASLGLALLQGAEAFLQDHPTILGHPVVLVPMDDRCERAATLERARAFCALGPRPAAVVGYMCTPGTEAALKVHEECGIPLINVTSSSPILAQAGSVWIQRLWPSRARQGILMGLWVRAKSYRRMLVLHETDPSSMAILEAFQEAVSRISPRPKVQAVAVMEAEINGRALFPGKDLPQIVYYVGEGVGLTELWKELPSVSRTIPWFVDGRVEFLTSEEEDSPQPKELYRIVLELPTGEASSPHSQYFRGRFGEPGVYTLVAYDALSVLAEALQRSARQGRDGTSWDPMGLTRAIREVRLHGLSGPVSFDDRGDRIQATGIIQKRKEGRWEFQWVGRVP